MTRKSLSDKMGTLAGQIEDLLAKLRPPRAAEDELRSISNSLVRNAGRIRDAARAMETIDDDTLDRIERALEPPFPPVISSGDRDEWNLKAIEFRESASSLRVLAAEMANRSAEDETPARPATGRIRGFQPSPEFHAVRWGSVSFHFTPMQAAVVKALFEVYRDGGAGLSERELADVAESASDPSDFRLKDLLGRHPAWEKMIVKTAPRIFAFVPPETPNNPR